MQFIWYSTQAVGADDQHGHDSHILFPTIAAARWPRKKEKALE
jgi:hypothetical protein